MIELLLIKGTEVIASLIVNASEAFDTGMVFERDGDCDTFHLISVKD